MPLSLHHNHLGREQPFENRPVGASDLDLHVLQPPVGFQFCRSALHGIRIRKQPELQRGFPDDLRFGVSELGEKCGVHIHDLSLGEGREGCEGRRVVEQELEALLGFLRLRNILAKTKQTILPVPFPRPDLRLNEEVAAGLFFQRQGAGLAFPAQHRSHDLRRLLPQLRGMQVAQEHRPELLRSVAEFPRGRTVAEENFPILVSDEDHVVERLKKGVKVVLAFLERLPDRRDSLLGRIEGRLAVHQLRVNTLEFSARF